MDGDFESAQQFWLQASKKNDAKAMFNLGLLHSDSKIGSASQATAVRWFKLAGQNGYAAADYHYAKLLMARGASNTEVDIYLQRAAANGSFSAKKLLGISNDIVARRIAPQINIRPTITAAPAASGYLTEDWLSSQRSSGWTIQMLAFQDEAKVKDFISQHKLNQRAAYFREQTSNGVLYKLVYGIYDSKELANGARKRLSSTLRQHGPWLRSMASVKAIIQKMREQASN